MGRRFSAGSGITSTRSIFATRSILISRCLLPATILPRWSGVGCVARGGGSRIALLGRFARLVRAGLLVCAARFTSGSLPVRSFGAVRGVLAAHRFLFALSTLLALSTLAARLARAALTILRHFFLVACAVPRPAALGAAGLLFVPCG